MAIFKRGKFYWYHFVFNGEHIQKSTKQKNQHVARNIEAAARTALAKGEVGIVERKKIPTFKVAIAAFLQWASQDHQMAPATAERYRYSSMSLLRFFKDRPLDKITPEVVEDYKRWRSAECGTVGRKDSRVSSGIQIRPATVNRELACLRAMFNHTIKAGIHLSNPISKTAVRSLREDNEQTRVLTYDEQARYLASASPTLRDVATLMLETGMRPEEVYRIQPRNVHLDEGYLFNPFGKTKAAKRRIHLTAAAREILLRRMADCGTFLFPCDADDKRPLPGIQSAHSKALRDSKVEPFRPYTCRHTWATRAVEAGIDLATLASMLGHSKINMVLRYAHPTQEHQTKAMEKMERHVTAQMSIHSHGH